MRKDCEVTLDICILGPVEAAIDGKAIHVGGRRPLTILAALTLDVGHAVPTDRLIDDVWGTTPPPAVDSDLQSHISRIRAALGHSAVVAGDHTYQLDVPPLAIDAVRFERATLLAEQCVSTDPEKALQLATEALQEWRGEPFGDLGDLPFLRPATIRLIEMRTAVMEIRIQAEIEIGLHARAIPLLQSLVAENPYRERLWYLLADGLARDGRRVEALRTLSRLADVLAEVGLSPSGDVRSLEQMIIDEIPPHVPHLADRRAHSVGQA